MAKQPKITRIKASDSRKPDSPATITKKSKKIHQNNPKQLLKTPNFSPERPSKTNQKTKTTKQKTTLKKILLFPFVPFVKLFNYIKSANQEISQVHWPTRKSAWKMTIATIAFTIFFIILVAALDAVFALLFNNLLKK